MDVNEGQRNWLNVREVAQRLGVHENTVRNWTKGGLLPATRLAGSRFHRYDPQDVDRLLLQRKSTPTSLSQQRLTIGPELVNASQLRAWAGTRDAQAVFPELIRRLLVHTPGVTNISIRAGDSVSAPGWDGRATSAGTAFLPEGEFRFEFGVDKSPRQKANDDYAKRQRQVNGGPSAVTFVFATPRRFNNASEWAESRQSEGVFAGVRVLDADDLEGWLQATPVVHQWISEQLGRKPSHAQTLDGWWARFRERTNPPLLPGIFLAGRERELKLLGEFLEGPPGVLSVRAPWRDEAIAFVAAAAAVRAGEGLSDPIGVIISSAEVWDRVVGQAGYGSLLPLFEDPGVARALDRGHHVILPIAPDAISRGATIDLPRPDRHSTIDILKEAGVSSDRAYGLAALARRSMPSFIRELAVDRTLIRPQWASPPAVHVVAPLVLVGAWTDSDADVEIVERQVEKPWSEITGTLLALNATDDPPFVSRSRQWYLASPQEAILVLATLITTGDLARWREMASEVLLEDDPRLDLSPNDRPMAAVTGSVRRFSSALRKGIAQGIALVGTLHDQRLSDGQAGAEHARALVREMLMRANADATGRTWQSLEDVLPLMAEAAPNEFLEAVHLDLDRNEPLLREMFQDRDEGDSLSTWSPHTGLLWALEVLCWSPDYLADATLALARLDAIDPGGKLSNRPLESLGNVLVGWVRQTNASLEMRVSAVKTICKHLPETGWRLLLALWPSHHSLAMPPVSPQFEDWEPESKDVSIAEYVEFVGELARLAVQMAGRDSARWAELSGRLGPLPPHERDELLVALEEVVQDPEGFNTEERLLLWEQLRQAVEHHRRYPTADWSLSEAPLTRMQAIVDQLEPVDAAARLAHLFDWRPDLPGVDPLDHIVYDRELLDRQTRAVVEALHGSIDGLDRLVGRSPVPEMVGRVLAGVDPEDLMPDLLTWLISKDEKRQKCASAWAVRKIQDQGVAWLRMALAQEGAALPACRERLAVSATPTGQAWDLLAEVDAELSDAYWQHVRMWQLAPEDVERAATELMARGRPWAALAPTALHIHDADQASITVTPDLVQGLLEAMLRTDPGEAASQVPGYEVGILLDYLESRADASVVARYEFGFFRLLEHQRPPRSLFAMLAHDPDQFVALVQLVYRGKDESKRSLSEHDQALAQHAWWVLGHWDSEFPGYEEGTLNVERLRQWVRQARDALAEANRADIGDEQIGQVLARSPAGADGIWPSEGVRELVEEIGSERLETGLYIGLLNQRGVTSRGAFEGGQQERDLAAKYHAWEKQTAGRWRRTSRLLRHVAESYERDAQFWDDDAELLADTD